MGFTYFVEDTIVSADVDDCQSDVEDEAGDVEEDEDELRPEVAEHCRLGPVVQHCRQLGGDEASNVLK